MVREQHRLGMLQVRVARQDDVEVRFGLGDERLAQGDVGGHELAGSDAWRTGACPWPPGRCGERPVCSRAPASPTSAGQLRLDGHVDVLAFHRRRT